jgi:serine/threonine protein kinase/dipeptidyl aminopeptidase/acylaminoacyl peptidase
MNDKSIFGAKPEQLNRLLTAIGLEKTDSNEQIEHTDSPEPTTGKLGSRIGRYKLLSILGEGGMGIVYLAEQQRPIKRQVALKVIKPGMDSARIIARFEAERQALALLDHPNIAHVYDAGTTETGRPYFVMEYVKGLPIIEYSDGNKLTIKDRLNLFLQVCQAVHYAHQKGIIHRDIKPSNILVSTDNDKAVPKIIDFGIAKAMNEPLTERTFYTEQGQLIGTPEYMSPEQANQNAQNIDIRTDVYSLGVVLYKLLTGLLPFDPETFRTEGIEQIRKVICEEDPMTPSMRLRRALMDESIELARQRQTDIRRLQLTLHGDLDWITLKALEKDRARRYSSVDAFVTDISNYLQHQPVSAAPPGTLYIVRKFVRRYRQRLAVLGAAVVLLIVILWAGWAHQQVVREKTHSEALEHERILAEAQKLFESRDVGTLNSSDSSNEALALIKPMLNSKHVGHQAQLLFASILVEHRYYDESVPRLMDLCRLKDNPEVAGTAHALLARVIWESQSLGTEELKQIEKHKQTAEQLLPMTAQAYYLRAMTALTIPEKLNMLTKALQLEKSHYPSRRLRALTYYASRKYEQLKDDALLMTYARPSDPEGYSLRATALKALGDYQEAIKCYETAIKLTDEEDPQYVELNGQRCETLMRMGEYERVLADARECLQINPTATILHFHSFCALTALGRYRQASELYRNVAESNPEARTRLRDWAMKYVFDQLEAGSAWHPSGSEPEGTPFLPMVISHETYGELSTKTHRLLTDSFSGCWSPDGTRIAFSMGVQGYSGVAVYNLKSQETDLLIVPGKDPKWSPNGQYIAFVRDCEVLRLSEFTSAERRFQHRAREEEEVWVMNEDGSEPRRLARSGGWPSWSSDSSRVYYHCRMDNMLYSISIEDNKAEPTPVLACSSSLPSVSPNENYVAYIQDGALRITDLVTKSPISEWTLCMPMWGGNWSPDEREFAFGGTSQYVEARAGLWIYDVNKKEAQQVLTGQIISASWSCDKKKMLLSLGPPYFEIWAADLDPNLSTADALGPARDMNEILPESVESLNRQLEIDPNQLLLQWERTALALWIGDDRASTYLDQMGQAIDRLPDQIGVCHWSAKGTFARPAVNKHVLPLTLLLVRKVVESNPRYSRDFVFDLLKAGQREEAVRLWNLSEAIAPNGSCRYDEVSDSYTIQGFGVDIWQTYDDFQFAHARLKGDGSITARIESVENVNEWTKAGIMIRSTLDAESPNAMVLATPRGIVSFQYRRKVSELTNQTYERSNRANLPHWLRLVRQGNCFIAQHSIDGTVWNYFVDSTGKSLHIEIPMDEKVYIGLAVTSNSVVSAAEARFSHVTISGQLNPQLPFTQSCDIPREFPPANHE